MYTLGIDVGASSVKAVALDEGGARILMRREVHHGAQQRVLAQVLEGVAAQLGAQECVGASAVGAGAEALVAAAAAAGIPASTLQEVPAATLGARVLAPEAQSLICIGAQSSYFVALPDAGGAPEFATNDSCASGTGSFFEDQMARLGLKIEDYSELALRAQSVPRLSGRCTVFAKTDIIHRQQEGVPVEDILQGLCHAMVKTFKATIVRGIAWRPPVALAGGVVLNAGVIRAVREVFKLDESELIASADLVYLQAAGAALHALAEAGFAAESVGEGPDASCCAGAGACAAVDVAALAAALRGARIEEECARREPLPQIVYEPGAGFPQDHVLDPACIETALSGSGLPVPAAGDAAADADPITADHAGVAADLAPVSSADGPAAAAAEGEPIDCALGVDVGSTSTNLVLVDTQGHVLDAQYLRTRGNPREAVVQGLISLGNRLGGRVRVVAAGTTGSGRALIGEMIGADAVRDEITAQARAAAAADPACDTVFEIGGQDSKYIHLAGGQVDDFQMNKVCAAGTGSFIEEQAARLGIALPDYGALALSSTEPVDLGERCTVFVETAIHAALAQGAALNDVAAGLCQSIIRNYLYRVVGSKRIGARIVLQGGVAYNAGIVAAFKQFFGDALTVSPWFAVSGAVGAALLALEAQRASGSATAEGAKADPATAEGAGAEPCVSDAPDGPATASGLAAESDAVERVFAPTSFRGFYLERAAGEQARKLDPEEIAANRAYFRKVDELYLEGYDPTRDPAKKTVGVPRCLMMHKLFPMVNAFFKELGYNVVLSDVSSEETVRLSQQASQGEVCYPVKLIHGHMLQLLDQDVDYIFFPSVHTIRHLKSKSPHNYACTYMQTAPAILARELGFAERGVELISPLFEMDWGQEAIASALLGVGEQLGRSEAASARAMLAGGFAIKEFTRKTEDLGEELLNSLKPDDRVIVLITRQYGILDPALNMGIADALLDRGCKVIMVSHLHAHDLDISRDYPGVCWPFGQHIISGAKLVRRDPRLYAVYLTNHGCGPDTMVSHYFRDEMGDKPYLQIEMDEHYSKVGVITRLEAFLNAIEHHRAKDERALPLSAPRPDGTAELLRADERAFMPEVGLFGRFAAAWLARTEGIAPELIAPDAGVVEAGKEGTDSKEYLSFAATLGTALRAAEAAQGAPAQLLLPSTEGTEADSQYDRVVRSILDARGYASLRVAAPRLEQLPWTLDDAWGLFVSLAAADVCYAAPADMREGLAARLIGDACSIDALAQAAREVAEAWEQRAAHGGGLPAVSVVGEWPLVYSDELSGGVFARLEAEGRRVVRMPFSEYLLFLWRDAVDADRRERDNAPFMLDAVSERAVMPLPSDALAAERAQIAAVMAEALDGHCGAHGEGAGAGRASDAACGAPACAEGCVEAAFDGAFGKQGAVDPGAGCELVSPGVMRNAEGMYLAPDARRDTATYARIRPADDGGLPTVLFYGENAPGIQATDNLEFDAHTLPNFAIPTEEKLERLAPFEQFLQFLGAQLGAASPFAASLDELRAAADEAAGPYRGGNGRYRGAKALAVPAGAAGTVAVASMYENTDVMLRLREGFVRPALPTLHLEFDGVLDKGTEEKLGSFLYYL